MFANFGKKLAIAALNVLKVIVYVACAPFVAVITLYGVYFVAIAFAWCVVLCAAFVVAILFFEATFIMFFVALFNNGLWAVIANMWGWLWSWFAGGSVALWPHIVKSFPPYIISGVIFMFLYGSIDHLKSKATSIKQSFATVK